MTEAGVDALQVIDSLAEMPLRGRKRHRVQVNNLCSAAAVAEGRLRLHAFELHGWRQTTQEVSACPSAIDMRTEMRCAAACAATAAGGGAAAAAGSLVANLPAGFRSG